MIRPLILALAVASPAAAQSQCGPTEQVIAALTGRYGEAVIAQGLVADPQGNLIALMQTYVNADTGTWTVLMTRPDGMSCMTASGGTYEAVKAKAGTEG